MKGFKYKLDLTKSQRLKVDQTLENARFVFNHFLNRRIKQYEDFKKSGLERKDFKKNKSHLSKRGEKIKLRLAKIHKKFTIKEWTSFTN